MSEDRFGTGGKVGGVGWGAETIYLNSLADVNVPSPTDGFFLSYDAVSGKWVARARTFTILATIKSPTVGYTTVWRTPIGCTCIKLEGRQKNGTSTVINARYNGTIDVATSDLTLTAADTWYSTTGINQTAWSTTDWLEIEVQTVGGATEITFVLTFTEP